MTRGELADLLSSTVAMPPENVEGGARWRHAPHVAPRAYLHRLYTGLDQTRFAEAVERYSPFAAAEKAEYLCEFNGMCAFNGALSLHGFPPYPAGELGPPNSLDYGNWDERPPGLRPDDFCAGAMVGAHQTADLVVGSDGGVRLVHSQSGKVGVTWPSLDTLLVTEIARLAKLHDTNGRLLVGAHQLWPEAVLQWDRPLEG